MLLFEIWSLGHQPFPNLTPLQVCYVVVAEHLRCVRGSKCIACNV